MSKQVGKNAARVDAYDKVTGRAKYTDDLCDRGALVVKVCRSTIAHGLVKAIDTSEAEAVPGVVKVLTCFDVPDIEFPTAGHPWSTDPAHQDVADRKLLNRHVRYYGDDVAAVIAEDEVAAAQAMFAGESHIDDICKAIPPHPPHFDPPLHPLLHRRSAGGVGQDPAGIRPAPPSWPTASTPKGRRLNF